MNARVCDAARGVVNWCRLGPASGEGPVEDTASWGGSFVVR
jgi:hypothetical protein